MDKTVFQQLQDKRAKLDEALRVLLADFEASTGCIVDAIHFHRVEAGMRYPLLSQVETEVRL